MQVLHRDPRRSIQNDLASLIMERGLDARGYEFESLIGLGTEQIDELRRLNRIAEEPIRVYQALVDLLEA